MKLNQQGSAHAVVTISLVAALVFALGWIFWQNFIMKKPAEQTKSDTPAVVSKPVSKTKKACLEVEKACYDIPSSWSLSDNVIPANEGFPEYDYATISDADGGTQIVVNSGISGIGGSCGGDDNHTWNTKIVGHEATGVDQKVSSVITDPGNLLDKINVVQAVFYDSENGYAPYVYLTGDNMSIKDGYEGCFPSQLGIYNSQNVKQSATFTSNYDGYGSGQEKGSDGKKLTFYKTETEAKNALESDNTKQVYTILKSLSYETQ